MGEKRCCPECFGDPGLKDSIIPELRQTAGVCSYCGTQGGSLILPSDLREVFETVVEIYERDDSGQPLQSMLRSEWFLFEQSRLNEETASNLLGDILGDPEVALGSYSISDRFESTNLSQWSELRAEMMHRNRWFLDQEINFDRLSELLDLLIRDPLELSPRWFRARIVEEGSRYSLAEMGAPPPRLAAHGRANPAGIPYLYLSSTPTTSMAELRPHTGESACVAEFQLPSLRVVDLRSPRSQVSPFTWGDADIIGQLRADLPLLERLGDELTRPVLPRGAPFEYIPSQYLCEFIKVRGFDGVVYRSSVSEGVNLAMFHPDLAIAIGVELYTAARVDVAIERV